MLLSYPDWKIPLTVYNYASDKNFGAVISKNNKPISLFSRILSKPHRNYITTEKEIIVIVECLKKLCGILFGYKINIFSDHKNLFYAATQREYQRVMCWRLIIEEFGPNIHFISGVDKIVACTLGRLPYTSSKKYKPSTRKDKCRANELLKIVREEINDGHSQLNILNIQREQQM